MFHTTATVERRAVTLDSVGDPSESWSTILDSVDAAVRNVSADSSKQENRTIIQGKEYTYHAKGYLKGDISDVPVAGDRFTDENTGVVYSVLAVYAQTAASTAATGVHHYKLLLEIVNADKS